jgi:CheY-like chemotaxis protein
MHTKRILIIDDSPVARDVVTNLVEVAGYKVMALESAIGATAAIVKFDVDVLILDMNMPVMSGERFAELVRKNVRLAHVRLVLMTGGSMAELAKAGESVGADAVLHKDELAKSLVPTIERLAAASARELSIEETPANRPPAPDAQAPLTHGESSKRVLIIDDSEISRGVVSALVEDAGYAAYSLDSAVGATAAILRHDVDALVVDMNMPVMSGERFAELVRKNVRLNHVRLILMTGGSEDELRRIGKNLGADAVIAKHDLAEQLAPTLKRLVTKRSVAETQVARALVVDANAPRLAAFAEKLKALGFEVDATTRGTNALGERESRRHSIVFVALSLEDLATRDFVDTYRDARRRAIPIMLVGDETDTALATEAMRLGLSGFVSTRLSEPDLRTRIDRALSSVR